jgi:hypothetical protein
MKFIMQAVIKSKFAWNNPKSCGGNKCNERIEVSVIESVSHALAKRHWTREKDMNGSQGLVQLHGIV